MIMDIELNIDSIILHGLSISHHERPLLQAAVEAELTRLLTDSGAAPSLLAGGATSRVSADPIQLTAKNDSTHLGHQIAQVVHKSIHR